MDESIEKLPKDAADAPSPPFWERGQWFLARTVAWGATSNWRMTAEWRVVRPVLIRYTGHLAVLFLAIAALFAANVDFPQAAALTKPAPARMTVP